VLVQSLNSAFDRIADFVAVQADEAGWIELDAVLCLQEAVGIGDAERATFAARLATVQPNAHAGAVLLGVLLGLFAAEGGDPEAP
jgi:hypothetical protein